jgi:hypothetical protein
LVGAVERITVGNKPPRLGVLSANEAHTETQVNGRKTMTKLTMFVLAALAAATVAIGALAAAPSATAATATTTRTASGSALLSANCHFEVRNVPGGAYLVLVCD